MIWKKDGVVWSGNSIIYNGKRIFNPREATLLAAGYVKEETQPSEQEILKTYEDAVQQLLDETAQSRGYDNTYTCLSYLSSTDEKWNRQAHAFNEWRDHVWQKCHEVLNAFKAGEIEQPTIEELIAQFPVMNWNDQE